MAGFIGLGLFPLFNCYLTYKLQQIKLDYNLKTIGMLTKYKLDN